MLRRQIELVDPRVIVVVGRFAAQALLGTDASIASLRGRVHGYRLRERVVPVVVSYHPAYLLRNESDKRLAWRDLQAVMRMLGLEVPHPGGRSAGGGTSSRAPRDPAESP